MQANSARSRPLQSPPDKKNPKTQRWNKVVFPDHYPLILDTESTKDRANSLTAVDHHWIRHKDHKGRQSNMVLITGRHKARLGTTTLQGPTSLETITTINEITASRFYVDNGEVFSESDADDIGECSVCNKPGLLFECSTAINCKRWFHLECTPLLSIPEDDWTCTDCTSNKP